MPRRDRALDRELHEAAMATLPSRWASSKRYIYNEETGETAPWSFKGREWQRELMDDTHTHVVIMKAAQMGVTEIGMSRAMHSVDAEGKDGIYLFPTEQDVSDFSAGRFQPMLDDSPGLADLFTDVSNVGLKRAGSTCLYLRGAKSTSSIKSVPASWIVLDEFDEMSERSVALARKRLIGHRDTWELDLSTPTYPGVGIHAEFEESDQRHWHVPCPKCDAFQALDFFKNIKIEGDDWHGAAWVCSECHEEWTEEERLEIIDRGRWVAHAPEKSAVHGYHISQLYSPSLGDRTKTSAEAIAREWLVEAQKSAEHLEDFYNSFLGLGYEAEGLKLTPGVIRQCVGDYPEQERHAGPTFLGVDVGSRLHYQVWTPGREGPKAVKVGSVDWAGLDLLMPKFNVSVCVIDAAPEREKAHEFRERFEGRVYLAFYPAAEHMSGQLFQWNDDNGTVNIHRTGVADRVATRLADRTIAFPRELSREAIRHMSNVYRALEEGPDGRLRAKWKHRGPDHTFHAGIYAEAALELFDDFDLEDLDDSRGSGFGGEDEAAWVSMDEGGFPSREEGGMPW